MQDAYPELMESVDRVSKTVLSEEQRVRAHSGHRTQKAGRRQSIPLLRQRKSWQVKPRLSGKACYDTFGMPLDFMQDASAGPGHRLRSGRLRPRHAGTARTRPRLLERRSQADRQPGLPELPKSEFEGYRQTRSNGCEVLAIIHNGQGAQELKPGEEGEVILDHTPFYAESGGQVGDRGWLYSDDHNTIVAEVKRLLLPDPGRARASGHREIPTQRKTRRVGHPPCGR